MQTRILPRGGIHLNRRLTSVSPTHSGMLYAHTVCFANGNQQQQDEKDEKQKQQGDKQNNDIPPELEKNVGRLLIFGWCIFTAYLVWKILNHKPRPVVSWTDFCTELLAKGEVADIEIRIVGDRGQMESERSAGPDAVVVNLIPGAVYKGKQLRVSQVGLLMEPDELENKIRDAEAKLGILASDGVNIRYHNKMNFDELMAVTMLGISVLILGLIVKSAVSSEVMKTGGFPGMLANRFKPKVVRGDQVSLKDRVFFKDVAGLHEPKVEIMEFVEYLKNPQRYKKLGARIPKGALLTGPPGCGKTLLAKALSSESGVPFLSIPGSQFVEMIGGLGAKRVRDLFSEARQKAPCIIYIDELDAIGRARGEGNVTSGRGEMEHTMNQLLIELDGMVARDEILLLGSTNRPEVLDKALTRPGRLDRHILIDLPTLAERKEIFEVYLARLKLSEDPANYRDRLAELTPGKTGADIANICNEAALLAARNMDDAITHVHFESSIERVIGGIVKKSAVMDEKEKRVLAYHEAGHALVSWLLETTDPVLKVSILQRTNAELGFTQYQESDRYLHSDKELFERMCAALGGRVAESVIFNNVTTAGKNDLTRVTRVANAMVKQLGMSAAVGPLSFRDSDEMSIEPYSRQLQHLMDQEASNLVTRAYQSTEKLITQNKDKLKLLAEELLQKEVLNVQDIEQLIGDSPFGKKKLPAVTWDIPTPETKPTSDSSTEAKS